MTPLFPIPSELPAPARDAEKLFEAKKFHETIAWCDKELAALDKQAPDTRSRREKSPREGEASAVPFQYYALTLLKVNALAELEEWKAAKEALGRYRVHFPRDPWGFSAGAEVTRRDPHVKDRAAVERAIELLEGEAQRLREKE